MTQQEKPTSPLAPGHSHPYHDCPPCHEREAAAVTPSLDVKRLARAIAASDGEVLGTDYMMYARRLAAEYDREAAQEKPTSPRTEAGRILYENMQRNDEDYGIEPILAIEREARDQQWDEVYPILRNEAAASTPSLDVERLAREFAFAAEEVRQSMVVRYDYRDHSPDAVWQRLTEFQREQWIGRTRLILARLDEGSATPLDSHDLPGHKSHECRICGNWTEGSATPEQKRSLDSIVRELADLSVADSSEFRDPTWEDAVRALIRRARASFDEDSATPEQT